MSSVQPIWSRIQLVAVISVPIRGVGGRFNGTKGGKRSGNERNGSTDQPPKSHKRLRRLLKNKKINHKSIRNQSNVGKKNEKDKKYIMNLSMKDCKVQT